MSLYTVIGVMSGTSIDGIDITLVDYEMTDNKHFPHATHHAKTFKYTPDLLDLLKIAPTLSANSLLELDKKLGKYFAKCIIEFIHENDIQKEKVDAIASHGHTIFHQPQKGYTYQIGCGDTISKLTNIKVINDFRQKDVIAGGQGAPLVPIGDKYLYSSKADAFLNIGGFCNISIPNERTIAFDISPGNLPINEIMAKRGLEYDADGINAREGSVDLELLSTLNALPFYNEPPPKSLGTEWLNSEFMSKFDIENATNDVLSSIVEHISIQIGRVCNEHSIKSLYITGGGAYNSYLIERIKEHTKAKIIIPEQIDIEFKEAIVFGLLGALYLEGRPNTISSVTGASHDVIGGVLHLP